MEFLRSLNILMYITVSQREMQDTALLVSHVWLLCPWDSPGENTEVDCHSLLQGIFLTQRLNLSLLHLLHWQVDSLSLSHLGRLDDPLGPFKSMRTWFLKAHTGTFQTRLLRLCTHNAEVPGLTPGQEVDPTCGN